MERNASLGYIAVIKQASKLVVAGVPNIYLPIYQADINTNANFQSQNPIIGNKFARRSTLRGQREHTGSILVEGEPNTCKIMANMFMSKGSESTSGSMITTPFTLSKTVDPIYYTADISYVTHVVRYVGMACSEIKEDWQDNELRLNCKVSALKVWDGREVDSVALQVITFKTDYDPSPTTGLFTGDTLQIYRAATDTYINCVVSAVTNATQITVTGTLTGAVGGDMVTIKPASAPSYAVLPTFTFANTEFRFAVDAATALTAVHTPLEQDSSVTLMHPFNDEKGEKRSGSYDPASLVRMLGDYEFTAKKYFDTPIDMLQYSNMAKRACVVRHFSYSGVNTYEMRLTFNNMTQDNPRPSLKSDEVLYSEIKNTGNYDATDVAGMGLTVIAGISVA